MDPDRPEPGPISDEAHERAVADLLRGAGREGPWGPTSQLWRVAREKIVFVAGGRAALLQLAHPYVGEAVAASDRAVNDPLDRFRRTFEAVYAWVFGAPEDLAAAARRVHAVHRAIVGPLPAVGRFPAGHRYHALDPGALAWVHATLVDGSVLAYELVFGPLAPADREAYWQDTRRFGLVVGLTELPPTWTAFEAYRDAMLASDTLGVTPAAANVGQRLLAGRPGPIAPVWATYRAMTAALLPTRFRAPFDLPFGRFERTVSAAAFATLRRGVPFVPRRLRFVPAYHEAQWRLSEGRRRVDHLGRAVEGAALGLLLGR